MPWRERVRGSRAPQVTSSVGLVVALSLAIVVSLALAGCCDCDPGAMARDLVGDDAMTCGYAPLGTDRAPVIDCALRAIASQTPFVAAFQEVGIDSHVRTYYAGDGRREWFMSFDIGGNGPACGSLLARRCTEFLLPGIDHTGQMRLGCWDRGDARLSAVDREVQLCGTPDIHRRR